jgi:MerR family transcriptional regulator, heat shock protein HspR
MDFELTDDTPVYVISVAAQLSGLHPQTLRAYDRLGLVSPGRAVGGGRRYSLRDVLALREVQRLSQVEGVNLSGIKRILELEGSEQRSRARLAELHAEIAQLRAELESTRSVAARLAGLLRGRNEGAALVPVRGSGPAAGVQGTGPADTGAAGSRSADARTPIPLPAARRGAAGAPGLAGPGGSLDGAARGHAPSTRMDSALQEINDGR